MRIASETSRWRAVGAAAAFVGAVAVAQLASPARSQQPPPPSGPQVQSVRLVPARPTVGRPVRLEVRVRDPALPIRGMRVDFGERGSRAGGSACRPDQGTPREPFSPGTPITIHARHRFRVAGPHIVAFAVTSGGCAGAGLRFAGQLSVTVAPRSPAPPAITPAPTPAPVTATAAQGGLCSHADTPTSRISVRTARSATLCLINSERQRRALRQLRPSNKLTRAAAAHTRDMVRRRFFEHEGPGGPSFVRRLGRVGYKGRAGENIGYETGADVTPRSIFRGWMESPPHKANMLRRNFRSAGIGVSDKAPVSPPESGATYTADLGSVRG